MQAYTSNMGHMRLSATSILSRPTSLSNQRFAFSTDTRDLPAHIPPISTGNKAHPGWEPPTYMRQIHRTVGELKCLGTCLSQCRTQPRLKQGTGFVAHPVLAGGPWRWSEAERLVWSNKDCSTA